MEISAPARLLFFFHETSWSGAPIQLYHLVTELHARGYEIAAAIPPLGAPESGPISTLLFQMGTEVFPIVDLAAPPRLIEMTKLCRHFDVVIANTLVMWSAVQASHEAGVPVIWFIHESQVAHQLLAQNPAIQPALMLADRLVMPTHRTAQLYRAFTQRAIEVVPYGIPAPKRLPSESRIDKRMIFFLLGSYERRKGQDIFLEAVAQIPADIRQRAVFRAAGRVLEKDFYEMWSRRAAAISEVELLGALEHDNALTAITRSDVLVSASRDETMPIAILEAMSLGKAIISTNVGGIHEWLQNNLNGILVPPENSTALARALTQCLERPSQLATLGKNAAETFVASFSIRRLGDTFSSLIESLQRDR
ncbi:MAG TPA: glycosyltransferase family 4 protein [Chthoniobacterales bacterium]|jgi:glycosyltransferase involved in cell wall biosynthesis